MVRLRRVDFWFSKQFTAFGFQPQGQASSGTVTHVLSRLPFFAFTQPYVIFRGLGQAGGTTPPVSGIEYTLSGGGLSELFVTTGTLGGGGLSYAINPMSKRTN